MIVGPVNFTGDGLGVALGDDQRIDVIDELISILVGADQGNIAAGEELEDFAVNDVPGLECLTERSGDIDSRASDNFRQLIKWYPGAVLDASAVLDGLVLFGLAGDQK